MHKLVKVRIAGFRRLHDFELDLSNRPFAVLIGANGVGKTSLFDVLTLLSKSALGKLSDTVSKFGGLSTIVTRGKRGSLEMEIATADPVRRSSFVYRFELSLKGSGHEISHETLQRVFLENPSAVLELIKSKRGVTYYNLVQQTGEYGEVNFSEKLDSGRTGTLPNETALSQSARNVAEPEGFRKELGSFRRYGLIDVGPRADIRMPQQMRPIEFLSVNGQDLVPFLYNLRESNRSRYDMVLDSLKGVFPDFVELGFPPVAAGMLVMTWKDRNFDQPMYINELSEGTLRFLWLVALLSSPTLPSLIMIDEPEASLHPQMLDLLVDLMREASQRTQLLVATQSDAFVRFLKPEELIVMDSDEDGFTTAVAADTMDIKKWLEDYSLGEVWNSGLIGGQ